MLFTPRVNVHAVIRPLCLAVLSGCWLDLSVRFTGALQSVLHADKCAAASCMSVWHSVKQHA